MFTTNDVQNCVKKTHKIKCLYVQNHVYKS